MKGVDEDKWMMVTNPILYKKYIDFAARHNEEPSVEGWERFQRVWSKSHPSGSLSVDDDLVALPLEYENTDDLAVAPTEEKKEDKPSMVAEILIGLLFISMTLLAYYLTTLFY